MADIAAMLAQNASQVASSAADVGGSFAKGAQLAEHIQATQLQRETLEQKKQEIELQKFEKVSGLFDTASKMKDGGAKQSFQKNVIPKTISALGMDKYFEPAVVDMLQADPLIASAVAAEIRKPNGTLTIADLKDSAKIAEFASKQNLDAFEVQRSITAYPEQMNKASEFMTQQKNTTERAGIIQGGQAQRQQNQITAAAERQQQEQAGAGKVEVAKKVAKEFSDWQAAGGKASVEANVKALENVANSLETGEVKSGGISNFIPGFKSDAVQTMVNPAMVSMKSDARTAIQGVLRQTLGAQFTEAEGERILNQVFDPKQPPKENARRIRNKVTELRQNAANKEAEFSAQGFQVKSAPIGDWTATLKANKAKIMALEPSRQDAAIKAIADKLNKTPEEIMAELSK